jgi:hypothetical protein
MFFVGMASIVALFSAIRFWRMKKRPAAWKKIADELGIHVVEKPIKIVGQCPPMQIFSEGKWRRFRTAIRGDAGDTKITLGDYQCEFSNGKTTTHVKTICILQNDRLDLPHCFLRRELVLFDRICQAFGRQDDIDFSEDKAFSGAFVLQGDDEEAVRNLFDADVRQWFVANAGGPFYFETRRNTLVFHTDNRRPPHEAKQLMQQALEIMNVLTKDM